MNDPSPSYLSIAREALRRVQRLSGALSILIEEGTSPNDPPDPLRRRELQSAIRVLDQSSDRALGEALDALRSASDYLEVVGQDIGDAEQRCIALRGELSALRDSYDLRGAALDEYATFRRNVAQAMGRTDHNIDVVLEWVRELVASKIEEKASADLVALRKIVNDALAELAIGQVDDDAPVAAFRAALDELRAYAEQATGKVARSAELIEEHRRREFDGDADAYPLDRKVKSLIGVIESLREVLEEHGITPF